MFSTILARLEVIAGLRAQQCPVHLGDVIFALASARGPSGHALVRASGPLAFEVLRRLAPGWDLANGPPRRGGSRTVLVLHRGVCLPARVMTFAAPRSFTGENSFELLVAGGEVAPRAVLERLRLMEGTRAALPGEFSARAYLNGCLSAKEAEVLPAIIGARTRAEVTAARAGEGSGPWSRWMDQAAHLLALVESGIDFVDHEGVVAIEPRDLRSAIERLAAEMDAVRARGTGQASRAEPVVVLSGRPSAGKSSLFNALISEGWRRAEALSQRATHRAPALAVVHEDPGTTRDALRAPLDLGSARWITLVDTPGLEVIPQDPGSPQEEAQKSARGAADGAEIVVWCDPHCRGPEQAGLSIGAAPAHEPVRPPCILVRTKVDRPGPLAPGWIGVCALDGRGLGQLRQAIAEAVSTRGEAELTRPTERQIHAIHDALAEIEHARAMISETASVPGEIIAEHLRGVMRALGEVTKPMGVEEVLGRIFARSCIGK